MDNLYQAATWLAFIGYWLLVVAVSLRIALRRRPFGVSLAWLLLIYIIPLFGVACYLLFGELNLGKKRSSRAEAMFESYAQWFGEVARQHRESVPQMGQHARPIHALSLNRTGIPSLVGNDLTLLDNGDAIFEHLIRDIDQAKTQVALEFYIWSPGGRADDVAEALIRARERNVHVQLLLDAAGSRSFFNSRWRRRLEEAGVEVVEALAVSPLRMFFRRLDLRQHRKIVVIDNAIGYTGSMNLADSRVFKKDAGVGEWVDIMLRITGPAVSLMRSIQAWDWEVETGERHLPPVPRFCTLAHDPHGKDTLQVIPSGPGLPYNVIQQVLLLSIYHAKTSLTLCSPYFVPSEQLMEALKTAAHRGVRVQLIVPDKNDSVMVEWASRSFFTELLRAGVEIHRFQGGLLHTKSLLIDDDHCLLGTVNLDIRSLKLNGEITLALDDEALCADLKALNDHYLAQSYPLKLEQWQDRPVRHKLVEQFFYMFAPLL
ncbi:cardiolipin synthase [Ferrimonas balearica]|uniref:cardiolipin synthase n=1 Tax=Ferrimonas balearica TaxID=44012 RepID=UPI001C9A2308|nr:cardiolipin synthase [Ferrimonas balearica]MBY5991236.1 cardiolipin synthase [Ferrimonas balearica]